MDVEGTGIKGELAKAMASRIACFGDQAASQPVVPPYRFLTLAEVFSEPTNTDWLVNNYLEAGTLGVLFGESGAMKTFVALDLALSIASGHEWHGNAIEKAGPVLYVAGEGYRGLKRRVRAWAVGHNIADINSIPFFPADKPARLRDEMSVLAVVEAIKNLAEQHGDPRLIVIDTLNRCFGPGGDENSTADMTKFVDALDELRNLFGCAILVVHHTGQGDETRSRGSSALHCAIDVEFRLAKSGNARVLSCTKSKDHEFPESIMFVDEEINTGWIDELSGREITSIVLRRISDSRCHTRGSNCLMASLGRADQIAMEAFEMACGCTGVVDLAAWRERAYQLNISSASTTEAKRQAFRRALTKLLELGHVVHADDEDTFRLAAPHANPQMRSPDSTTLQQ